MERGRCSSTQCLQSTYSRPMAGQYAHKPYGHQCNLPFIEYSDNAAESQRSLALLCDGSCAAQQPSVQHASCSDAGLMASILALAFIHACNITRCHWLSLCPQTPEAPSFSSSPTASWQAAAAATAPPVSPAPAPVLNNGDDGDEAAVGVNGEQAPDAEGTVADAFRLAEENAKLRSRLQAIEEVRHRLGVIKGGAGFTRTRSVLGMLRWAVLGRLLSGWAIYGMHVLPWGVLGLQLCHLNDALLMFCTGIICRLLLKPWASWRTHVLPMAGLHTQLCPKHDTLVMLAQKVFCTGVACRLLLRPWASLRTSRSS